jgi:PAS domain S-box-containing protein
MSSAQLPQYLEGALLLRGARRLRWTAILLAGLLIVDVLVQRFSGRHMAVVVTVGALAVAWLWGRMVGLLAGSALAVISVLSALAAGTQGVTWTYLVLHTIVVGMAAFAVGYVADLLERALGDQDRTATAYDQLEAEARDRMLKITDQVPIGLYRTTLDGRVINGNDALITILGFPDKESLLQTNVWDHYVDPSQRRAEVDELGMPVWSEFELVKADGARIWVRDWAIGVLDDNGEIQHFDGVIEDITQRRLVDEMFRAAFEEAPTGMTISSPDGRIVRGNQAAADMLGRTLAELVGLHHSDFTADEDVAVTPSAIEKAAGGDVIRYEKRLVRPDGSSFWGFITLAPISEASEPGLFISHVVDETERRKVRATLENLVRSKDDLIASVSHELRTPLTVIHGLAQELDASWASFSVMEQKEFIALIAQHSEEVGHIVEDLLVAARADIGKLPIHAETLDLRTQIDEVLLSVPALHVVLDIVGDEPPVAFADPNRVRQIIRNLLTNAARYGGDDVRVRCGIAGGRAFVEVADDGSGVAPADIAKIFEPYERAHNADGQPMSVGLGLTVSRTLAELMGGTLEYSRTGGWSVFALELPVPGSIHRSSANRVRVSRDG